MYRQSAAGRKLPFGLLIGLSVVVGAFAQDRIIGVARVIDGETIEIYGQRIRLFGIDAPESSQLCERPTGERWRCGQQASFALADRILLKTDRGSPDEIVFSGNRIACSGMRPSYAWRSDERYCLS